MIVLEMGGARACRPLLKEGEEVLVMGPTGTPTEIPKRESSAGGGGLGNAVLFSIAKALREKSNKVLYFAGYKNGHGPLQTRRDREGHRSGDLGTDLGDDRRIVRRIAPFAATSCRRWSPMPRATRRGRWSRFRTESHHRHRLRPHDERRQARGPSLRRSTLKENHTAIGSINSPMQCMMKEVCAQCLQRTSTRHGQRAHCLLLLQPGPAARQRRLEEPGRPPAPEHRAGKLTGRWVERLLATSQ